MDDSNYIVVLNAENEAALEALLEEAEVLGIESYGFHEGYLNNSLTAIALQPGDTARQICANLPLALSEAKVPCGLDPGGSERIQTTPSIIATSQKGNGGSHD